MEIADSARRHGYTDQEIRHAWQHLVRFRAFEHDGELRWLIIGPDPTGALLELVAVPGVDPDTIIHADLLRPKFYEYL